MIPYVNAVQSDRFSNDSCGRCHVNCFMQWICLKLLTPCSPTVRQLMS